MNRVKTKSGTGFLRTAMNSRVYKGSGITWPVYDRKVFRVNLTVINLLLGLAMPEAVGSPVAHHGGPGSMPSHLLWDLWQTKWQWDRFFSDKFGFQTF